MKLRIAKKIMMWSKGDGCYIGRSKDHQKSRCKHFAELRPEYYDEERGRYCYPSFADIDIVRRARTRMNKFFKKNYRYEPKH